MGKTKTTWTKGTNPKKKKGTISKKKQAWDSIGEMITGELTEKAISIMKQLSGKDFLYHYEAILEYFKPKLSRSDMHVDGEMKVNFKPQDFINGVGSIDKIE